MSDYYNNNTNQSSITVKNRLGGIQDTDSDIKYHNINLTTGTFVRSFNEQDVVSKYSTVFIHCALAEKKMKISQANLGSYSKAFSNILENITKGTNSDTIKISDTPYEKINVTYSFDSGIVKMKVTEENINKQTVSDYSMNMPTHDLKDLIKYIDSVPYMIVSSQNTLTTLEKLNEIQVLLKTKL